MRVLTQFPNDEQPQNLPAIMNQLEQMPALVNDQQHDPVNNLAALNYAMSQEIERLTHRRSWYEQERNNGKEYATVMLAMLDEAVNRFTMYLEFGSDELSIRYWLNQSTMF